MNSQINLALIGASGVVGEKIMTLLENRATKINNFYPLGDSSVGKEVIFNNSAYVIQDLKDFDHSKINIAIFSQLLMALNPIHRELKVDILNVSTYQAVSGTGKQAVQELKNQIKDSSASQDVYSKKIAFNVIPQCDIFLENNFTKEEMKLVWETQKILDKNIEVQATCVRVPVINGHSEAVFLRTIKETTREEVIELLNNSSGIKVIDNPESLKYPTPLENANDTEDVFVGRIRSQTINNENWTSMWIVADNVYGKGAALNTVQILEGLVENNKLC